MRMKKWRGLAALLLAVCLAVVILPGTAEAKNDGGSSGAGEGTASGTYTGANFVACAKSSKITLTGDVTLSTTATFTSAMTIDLAGYNITFTGSDTKFISFTAKNSTMTIQSTKGKGTISFGSQNSKDSSSYYTLYAACSSGSNTTISLSNVIVKGMATSKGTGGYALFGSGKGKFTAANCEIYGGDALAGDATVGTATSGTFTNTNNSSTVQAGSMVLTDYSGDLKIGSSTLVLTNSTLRATVASGSITVTEGTMAVSGGSYSGSVSTSGTGTVSMSGGSLTMTGGTVNNGITVTGGTLKLSGATVNGGVTMSSGTLTLSGGTVNGGITASGGTLDLTSYSGNLTVGSDALTLNKATFKATIASGAISVTSGTMAVSGGSHSGSVTLAGGSLTMTGGTISNGITMSSGTLTLSGGTVSNGITATGGTLTIQSGTVNGGITVTGATLTLSGGTVSGDITMNSGTLECSGYTGSIVFGSAGTLEYSNVTFKATVTNSGAISVTSGTMNVAGTNGGTYSGSITGNAICYGGSFTNEVTFRFTVGDYAYVKITDESAKVTIKELSGSKYVDVKGKVYANITVEEYDATIPYIVTLTSRIESGSDSVVPVSGGGSVTYANGTTVSVIDYPGHTFLGWFTGYSTTGNGTCLSTEHSYFFRPTEDITLYAVFGKSATHTAKLTVDTTNYQYSVNSGSWTSGASAVEIPYGSEVSVKYTGTKAFSGWFNASDKLVSTSETYSFTIYADRTLKVRTASGSTATLVVFQSPTGQVYEAKSYAAGGTVTLPASGPIKMGSVFDKWSMTAAEIEAKLGTEKTIFVTALYKAPETTYKITVTYEGVTRESDEYKDIPSGYGWTLEAPEIAGYTFSCWKEGSTVISTNEKLEVRRTTDAAFTAVYVTSGSEMEKEPIITMVYSAASVADDKYVATFTVYRDIPDGWTLVEHGIIAAKTDTADFDAASLVIGGTGVKKAISSNTESSGNYTLNITYSSNAAVFHAKGYMILKNADGEVITFYTDCADVNLSTVSTL